MRTFALLSFALALAAVSCTAPEEAPPPPPISRDPVVEARIERTRTWVQEHSVGCFADAVEVEMPADLRELCTFDTRGELFKRVDSRQMRDTTAGRSELVLQTVLEAQTPNMMAARCLIGKVEFAALRKLRIVFAESATEISVRGSGGAVWWIDAPSQRQRGGAMRLVLPPSSGGS
ncbi:MAG: hypothetical protein IPN34_27195 [Planctomycetes bacterium]|nr:hypothetical protein [Planctomycetota bacterium]